MHPVRSYSGRPVVMATSLAVLLGTGFRIPSPGILFICAIAFFKNKIIYPLSVSPCFFVLLIRLFPNQNSGGHHHFSFPRLLLPPSLHLGKETSRAEVATNGKVWWRGEDGTCILQEGVFQNCYIVAWNVTMLIKISFGIQHHRKKKHLNFSLQR